LKNKTYPFADRVDLFFGNGRKIKTFIVENQSSAVGAFKKVDAAEQSSFTRAARTYYRKNVPFVNPET